MSAPYRIRLFGDPVLRQRAAEITEIDGRVAQLAEDMIATMHDAPGVGLAANQVGVLKRLFVFDIGEGPQAVVNPVISDHRGEWVFEEGCLSIPGLSGEVVRPKEVHLTGVDLDGQDVSFEADELLARVVQHELDHLDGVLFIDRMEPDLRKEALRVIRELTLAPAPAGPGGGDDDGRVRLRIPGI